MSERGGPARSIDDRDDWDTAVLRAFAGKGAIGREAACRLFLETVGEPFARYVRHILPTLSAVLGGTDAAHIDRLVQGYADYHRAMARALDLSDLATLSGWDDCRHRLDEIETEDSGAILLTFQIGLPLLLPRLCATRRPTSVFMHTRNAIARSFMTERSPPVGILDVATGSAIETLRCLGRGEHVVANIDTVYRGTRARGIRFLDHLLEIPAGLLDAIPKRSGARVFAVALLRNHDDTPKLELRQIDPANDRDLAMVFEPLVLQAPYQWMGWGSLRPDHL